MPLLSRAMPVLSSCLGNDRHPPDVRGVYDAATLLRVPERRRGDGRGGGHLPGQDAGPLRAPLSARPRPPPSPTASPPQVQQRERYPGCRTRSWVPMEIIREGGAWWVAFAPPPLLYYS